jgi:2,3-bisphosphoglycerate-dependent phosphoglycerate mutase
MIERVFLIRHGQTDWNMTGRWQGQEPVPLNAQGFEQARALASYLRQRPIQAIYSSDLSRAFQTAAAIGEAVGVMPQADTRWRELHLGIFQGLTKDEIEATHPTEWAALHEDYWGYKVPNGESRREMQARALSAWEAIVAAGAGREVAIVSHGGTLKILLLTLFDGLGPDFRAVDISNTSVTVLERDGEHWRVAELAVTPHLVVARSFDDESRA